MDVQARVLITGLVQGVFYRSAIRNRARLLKVRGWIKNLPDGGAEGLFEGEKEQVEALIKFCKSGHPPAAVVDIHVQWEEAKNQCEGFEIR